VQPNLFGPKARRAKSFRRLAKGDDITSPRRQSDRATQERINTVFGGGMHTFSHRLGASAVSRSVDRRRVGGGVCPKAAGASRWWEFVGLRVGVATNVGGSVYIVERHDVKGFRGKFALWAHHDHVNSRKPEFKTSLERRQAVKPNLQTIGLGQTD
jgi:hypothetical protein